MNHDDNRDRFGRSPFDPDPPLGRKDAQLCSQAAEALGIAFATSADPMLQDVLVASVAPAPDIKRLRVTVHPVAGLDRDALAARLERARGYLRSELASAIHRKRTPELVFRVLPSDSRTP